MFSQKLGCASELCCYTGMKLLEIANTSITGKLLVVIQPTGMSLEFVFYLLAAHGPEVSAGYAH